MQRAFRKYHGTLALIMMLPVALTTLTGILYSILDEWLGMDKIAEVVLEIHNGEIFGLEKIYPLLNGLGLIGLLVTGASMTSLFRRRPSNAE
ncbi:MAG TPA: peptidase [Cyanobacteria bacterium UBA11149]|nr:peptidase [Cyanobacteria bacterium UBA11367]HBE60562.1 peptidase [Cyanobacteria bacterium UBA11366]HBK63792.1 peptidase [Cyanobacteria bacterium UBA11166]HBR72898.1 peptidase [Cyanobacteria bacterium UBA11159]HBS69011.1 peptidase [Cyanobacteria bacterium UBA11153]HBW89584.1 peptidase [Cyanobacteria bacterium UBA11149]HCA93401.1 peptidase [Cyanobacteria bacterium UBA9226]